MVANREPGSYIAFWGVICFLPIREPGNLIDSSVVVFFQPASGNDQHTQRGVVVVVVVVGLLVPE